MRYTRVHLESMGYELPANVVTSRALEDRLGPLYDELRMQRGQLEALTGIRERRWWNSGHKNADGALAAARKALAQSGVTPADLGILIYGGVSRDHLEPATACAVASGLGISASAEIFDISNACLGVLNGIVAIANRIELGQIRAGMIVSCESAREITGTMIDRMLAARSMDNFRLSVATLTGGSGAVAMLLTDGSFSDSQPRLRGGVALAAPEYHDICRWEFGNNNGTGAGAQYMETDAVSVMKHGVTLGASSWQAFLRELDWNPGEIDRVICHQVGSNHRETILKAFGVPVEKDFSTFEFLGNMGTVSLPLTAALADERGVLVRGERVGFLGIGSGLNCLMLGWEW